MSNNITPKNFVDSQKLLDLLKTIIKPDASVTWNFFNELSISEFVNSFKDGPLVERYTRLAVVELNKLSKQNLSDFCKTYTKIEKDESSKQREESTWSFYIPFLADVDKSVKLPFTIKILGYYFVFTSMIINKINYTGALPNYLLPQSEDIKRYIRNSKSVFIKVNSEGFTDRNAWSKISLPYDVLRGIIEFTINFASTRIFSAQSQRAEIHHPNWILAFSKYKTLEGLSFNTDNEKKAFLYKFNHKTKVAISNNSKLFSKRISINSSLELMITALRQYADALSSKYNYNQLLGLWQVAETLTLSNPNSTKTSEIASRLNWFTRKEKFIGNGYKNTLLAIAKKRNDIVHRGISEISDDDVDFLKVAVEMTLLWFFKNIKHLKTINHVSEFYRLRDKNDSDIKTIKEILKFVTSNLRSK